MCHDVSPVNNPCTLTMNLPKKECVPLTMSEDGEEQVTGGADSGSAVNAEETMKRPKIPWRTTRHFLSNFLLVTLGFFGSFLLQHQSHQTEHHNNNLYVNVMNQIRLDAAIASIKIMQNDTLQAAAESYFVDIGPLADVVDKALDTVGFRRVFLELFETYSFSRETLHAAKVLGVRNFQISNTNEAGHRPESLYSGIPSDRWPNETDVCTGCLPALHHWVGAISADKFIRDGSLLLDPTTGERLSTPRAVIEELQRMTKEEEPPDMVPFHSQHGFIWQYVPVMVPTFFDAFPFDLAVEICSPDLIYEGPQNKTFGVIPGLDIVRECRHGFGHAVFYELAMRQLGRKRQDFSSRTQFRARGGFVLTDENLCEANRLCKGAPGAKTYHQCIYGVKHAYYEVSMGPNMSVHSKDVLVNVCGFSKHFP